MILSMSRGGGVRPRLEAKGLLRQIPQLQVRRPLQRRRMRTLGRWSGGLGSRYLGRSVALGHKLRGVVLALEMARTMPTTKAAEMVLGVTVQHNVKRIWIEGGWRICPF